MSAKKIIHKVKVDFQAGERVGVADAPRLASHRTATPSVRRFSDFFCIGVVKTA